MHMRRYSLIAIAAAAGVVAAVAAWHLTPMPGGGEQASTQAPVKIGGPFEMTAHTGENVTERSFDGKLRLVFFGYTFCPDVCPTTLNSVALTLDELGDDAARVQALFITVDPARDTPEVLAEYTAAFHPGILGLSGSPEQTAAIAKSYKAYFAKVEDSDNDPEAYLMDHTVYIYLMDRDGEFLALFSYPSDPQDMASEIVKYLKQAVEAPAQPKTTDPAPGSAVPGDHVQAS